MTKNLLQIQSKMMGMFPMIPVEEYGLVHVLRAIGERVTLTCETRNDGTLWISYSDRQGYVHQEHWNLAKPLADQEDSVIDFLHSILCVQES